MEHAKINGLLRPIRGEENKSAKLTNKDVNKIKKLLNLGTFKQYEIAKMFNIRDSQINRIKRGKRWKHHNYKDFEIFTGHSHKGESAGGVKLKNGEVWLIKLLISKKFSLVFISKMFKVKPTTIGKIKKGDTWIHIIL